MDFTCSPSRAETLHLSPTHLHNVDPILELRKLRRSISKSPSRLTDARSPSRSPASPLSPTPGASYQPLDSSHPKFKSDSPQIHPEGLLPATRKLKNSFSRSTPFKGVFRNTRSQSRSPMRSALSVSSDSGNGTPPSSQKSGDGQENQSSPDSVGEDTVNKLDNTQRKTCTPSGSPPGFFNFSAPADKSLLFARDSTPVKSSPLKRSDGLMNLDQPSFGSPSAKRRSLHGAPFDIARDLDDLRHGDNDSNFGSSDDAAEELDFRSSLAPRFAPVRKSHLQQRLSERPGTTRNRTSMEIAVESPTFKKPTIKNRPRNASDSASSRPQVAEKPLHRTQDEAGTTQDTQRCQFARSYRQPRHPLSQALSPTSPSSGPEAHGDAQSVLSHETSQSRPSFSKSLPIGALRPSSGAQRPLRQPMEYSSVDQPFATPDVFKMARPDPAAFRSTGLISKKHRNPDDMPPPPTGQAGMPDTPCKKASAGLAIPSSPSTVKSIARPRFSQPEFGTPSKPFNMHSTRPSSGSFGQQPYVFGEDYQIHGLSRKSSFVSNEGEESGQSPINAENQGESQSSADELPPTPTKPNTAITNSRQNSLRSNLLGRRPSIGLSTFVPPNSLDEQISTQPSLPSAAFRKSVQFPIKPSIPQTPAESGLPDPSQLSISPSAKGQVSPIFRTSWGSFSRPPETPTSRRDGANPFTFSVPSTTPRNHPVGQDIDHTLICKFKKVEWYGRGEYSEVYKVYESPDQAFVRSNSSPANLLRAAQTPLPDKVWIVKKLKAPSSSMKLRHRRLREASIMQALGRSDHIVHLEDTWESNSHLYLQTEFCEEGCLDAFLARQGNCGRLDDFRIWKILLEIAQGIKHIHHAGFIHLDIKPANIFIDFEGVLKIGDFGHASEWPAPANVEGEGDRRYIGPDLLQGGFDKPADIFALGMVMYEIAGNCIPPDNGASWQKLRSGDFSGLPSLTSESSHSLSHDSIDQIKSGQQHQAADVGMSDGNQHRQRSHETFYSPDDSDEDTNMHAGITLKREGKELDQPPSFMLDPHSEESLDSVVQWMMSPLPVERPIIDVVLETHGCQWVNERRRGGAIVYEGKWGPANHVVMSMKQSEDTEMIDA